MPRVSVALKADEGPDSLLKRFLKAVKKAGVLTDHARHLQWTGTRRTKRKRTRRSKQRRPHTLAVENSHNRITR